MNVHWISLAALLAVLSACPDTTPEASMDVARAREEIAIEKPADAGSVAMTTTLQGPFEIAAPVDDRAKTASGRDAAPESAIRLNH